MTRLKSGSESDSMPVGIMNVANISVTIATLDRPSALARCLDALLAGERLPAEIVVVDQGHDDLAQVEVEARRTHGVTFVYVQQSQRGLSAARNAGLANSHYPIVAVTDDDCVPDPCWIDRIERLFAQANSPDAITGRVLPLGPETPGLFSVSSRERSARMSFSSRSLPWSVGSGGNYAVVHQWYDRLGGCDERLGAGSLGQAAEDTDLFHRLLCNGARIDYDPDVVVYHERQDEIHRLTSRWRYGHGIGAFCTLRLRQRDIYGVYILARWAFSQMRMFLGALVRQDRFLARQYILSLRGTVLGLRYGWRVPGRAPTDGGLRLDLAASNANGVPHKSLLP